MNILRLISIKLDIAIIAVVDKCLIITSPHDRIANRAHDLVGIDNIKDIQQETGFYDGLQYKALHIKKPKANQIKVGTIIEAIADQYLTTISAQRRVANRACDNRRLQQNIRVQVVKFVQNADAKK